MKLAIIPRSKAKTAWGLLQDVKHAIEKEPRRANMEVYQDNLAPTEGGPACGTVGCFAGWVVLLRMGRKRNRQFPAGEATNILGEDCTYTFPGHSGLHWHYFNNGAGDACETTAPGTRAHARAVIARVNRFMRANAAKLKRRKLV